MEGARALSVRGSQSSRKWHAVEPLGDERERKVRLVRRHHVPRALHGREGEVVGVGLDVARALRRGAVEVGGEPRLPRRGDGELERIDPVDLLYAMHVSEDMEGGH